MAIILSLKGFYIMRETIQVLQVILFAIPVAALWMMGILLILRPVNIINRRWGLLIFMPLLAANVLAVLENYLSSEQGVMLGWEVWLILGVDLVLGVVFWLNSRGFLVYGITAGALEEALTGLYREKGASAAPRLEEERLFLDGRRTARILTVEKGHQIAEIKITERFNETVIQAQSKEGREMLKSVFPMLRRMANGSRTKSRAVGVLYLVLGLVFSVLSWIFFFEPRLFLIE